ncbi:hypothetical protein C5167_041902 [Papaver somniferum]|nr:hypothetical protein C5167_041902 [Papaver somniferum]
MVLQLQKGANELKLVVIMMKLLLQLQVVAASGGVEYGCELQVLAMVTMAVRKLFKLVEHHILITVGIIMNLFIILFQSLMVIEELEGLSHEGFLFVSSSCAYYMADLVASFLLFPHEGPMCDLLWYDPDRCGWGISSWELAAPIYVPVGRKPTQTAP